MTEDLHARARQLIDEDRVEGGLSYVDRAWLADHLHDCGACLGAGENADQAIAWLRSSSVEMPRNLASRTQLRVRLRADELQERSAGHILLWVVSAVSWVLGIASAPWVWAGFKWVGEHAGWPRPLWEVGFVLWWAVPALFAVAVVVARRKSEFGQDVD